MQLIVYGDFNCPYSRLASLRVDELLETADVTVEWRAVQHDSSMPSDGVPVDDELRAELDREITEIRGMLRPTEQIDYAVPDVRPNSAADCAAFAGLHGTDADAYRRTRFEAIWGGGGAPTPAGVADGPLAEAWQREWEGFDRRMVPLLIEDGGPSRGIEALVRLRELLDR